MGWLLPTMDQQKLDLQRDVVKNERRERVDNAPYGRAGETINAALYPATHPYSWPVIGWMKDIEAISTKDCLEFHKTYYSPNNATVVVVGDVDTQKALKLINEHYGPIPPSTIPPENLPVEPPQTKEKRLALEKPVPADKLLIAFHTPNALHPDYPVLEVAQAILFNGRSSRLFRKLVSDTQIAGGAGGWVNQVKDPGLYVIDVTMQPKRTAAEAEKVVYAELKRLAAEEVPQKELDKAVNRLETSFWQNLRTADTKAQALGFYEVVAGDYRRLFDEVAAYRRVKPADVKRVARVYFHPENRTVVTAKPQKNTKTNPKTKPKANPKT